MNVHAFALLTTRRALSNMIVAQCSDTLGHVALADPDLTSLALFHSMLAPAGKATPGLDASAHVLAFAGTIALVCRAGSAIPTAAPRNDRPADTCIAGPNPSTNACAVPKLPT